MRRLLFVVICCICLVVTLSVGELNAKPRGGFKEGGAKPTKEKVCLCHIPPGNPAGAHTICVGSSAVRAHLGHGDTLGSCPAFCGGEAGIPCDEGQYCQRDEGVCDESAEGVCADVPVNCPAVIDPVCGCDGETYDNECYAAAAGVAIAYRGECDEEQVCGGSTGETCDMGQYCMRDEGECDDETEGVCADMPLNCPSILAPVCGCDDMTYDNECEAAAAGVNVAYIGECDGTGGLVCGGDAGDTCMEDQFCKREEGECDEDAEGLCTDTPTVCPAIFDLVCGCDEETYANECMADAAGVTVAYRGECDGGGGEACGGTTGVTCEEGQYCMTAEGECDEDAEGTCTAIPIECPLTLDPVCGCDGMTYDNECYAAAAGVNVASMGECEGGGEACGGTAGETCAEGQYCMTAEGECDEDAEGVCTAIPTECTLVLDPVCGCDGTTYDNECFAAAAGVNVASMGECEAGGGACGGTAGDTCTEGQYCMTAMGECAEDAEGVCTAIPTECPLSFDPVCGCDGMTYDNECYAAAAGVNVASMGECEAGGEACGGTAGDTCTEGQYCMTAMGECAEDAEGVCTAIPTECPLSFDPVCGCDGMTYDNECYAAAAGVNVASMGECEAGGGACGGTAGDTCTEGQYCMTAMGECAEDAEGVCTAIPTECPLSFDPVCGCDGVTYDNDCYAAAAGVNVASTGECDSGGGEACGGTGGESCAEGQYCMTAEGECDENAEGICTAIPTECPLAFDPVCGCDGETYDNDCYAAAAGVNVASTGECDSGGGEACGGTGGESCAEGQYCMTAEGECDENAEGICTAIPTECPLAFDPVCGCDGETYSNECFAAGEAVNVASTGECVDPGR